MINLILFVIISLVNVLLHILRSILVIKSTKLIASSANCICYTFSAVVIKFISESSLITSIIVAMITNFFGCYIAMMIADKFHKFEHNSQES
jgi:hypothetical protein